MQREVAGWFGAVALEPAGQPQPGLRTPTPQLGGPQGETDEHSCWPPAPSWQGGAGQGIGQSPLC